MHVVSDSESERSGKIFLAENEWDQGRDHDAEKCSDFPKNALSCDFGVFGRPCRGLSPGKGFAPKRSIWLVETELADTLVEQYFKEITAGKSWRKCLAYFPEIISQKWRFLEILSTDFAEKRPKSR